ncbi:glycoside hydrolase family 81 protein [Sporormia fimetaria CBS 119925]|uniref:glucan endo-1,3-beta-D-glucosidase n=1 Tax=Sporormia fimetaria CBS 119925 TaxID=1340428 RepID=A0A6A6UYZ9_9PLEO|nr:glycoside hydrolase family 81 protein [Sporormia fimetaria CBS 119925]
MAKLAFALALVHATFIQGLPAGPREQMKNSLDERQVLISTDLEVTTSYSSLSETFQSATVTEVPTLTGSIVTGLPTGITRDPIGPSVIQPTETLAPIDSSLAPGPTEPSGTVDRNIFVPMASDAPPPQIPARNDHLVEKLGILDGDVPIETNKFYANFFLGDQDNPVWTHPYSLAWAKGRGETWGIAIAHVEREQFAWGPGEVPRFFSGPIGIQNIVFSAAELGEKTVLTTDSLSAFSVNVNLAPTPEEDPIMSLPCVQGMGFVTAIYNGATPQLNSGTYFRTLEFIDLVNGITYKYLITLNDNTEWLMYVTPVASAGAPPFELVDVTTIEGPSGFVGMIQVAKNPAKEAGGELYDSTAGAFAINATLTGSVDGSSGKYKLAWGKDGVQSQTLLMFALPHHIESFDDQTKSCITDLSLVTTTKGYARAVRSDSFTMVEEDLPTDIGFDPWVSSNPLSKRAPGTINLDASVISALNRIGALELGEDFDRQTRLDSMYYSGKALAKFASIVITLQNTAQNTELAAAGLEKLKIAFPVFTSNTQPFPLVYDTRWKGVVSSGTYETGNEGVDFGNTLYNDHHFHYGYFVYTAAVIGHLDPAWLEASTNRAWTNTLVRDFANPSDSDPYFPAHRSFDWYHGHSWAKGLFASADGKDQESTSEDTFASYALKMWGRVSGDANLEARGNLQLAIQKRSLRNYFLLEASNTVQPKPFLPNKVTGILFENKIDHTTYFGANQEFIQGIHMLPLNPTTPYIRSRRFAEEEWEKYFSGGRAEKVEGGWKGVLFGNLATIRPEEAWRFFTEKGMEELSRSLDSGASLTWYLNFAAVMLGERARVEEGFGEEVGVGV